MWNDSPKGFPLETLVGACISMFGVASWTSLHPSPPHNPRIQSSRKSKAGLQVARPSPRLGTRSTQVGASREPTQFQTEQFERPSSYDYPPPGRAEGPFKQPQNNGPPPPGGLSGFTKALIAGSFVIGLGAGVYFASEVNVESKNVASTQIVDEQTPSSAVCMANGYSSMVFDQRVFVSFNPFNVYVAQPEVKPGCILRRSNVNVLEKRGLVKDKEVDMCKKGMNTFAYVGSLDNQPEVSCVYHSEDAENQFIVDPRKAVMGDGFRPQKPK